MRPAELARRGAIAGGIVLAPIVGSSYGTLRWCAVASLRKVYALATWGSSAFATFGASSYFVFSSVCCGVAGVLLAIAAVRLLRGRARSTLERLYLGERALYLLHGAASPFVALSATQHLSPTGRGRVVLAQYLATVLEHQAFLALATGGVAFAMAMTPAPAPSREELAPQPAPSLLAAFVLSGLTSHVLARTFTAAAGGLAIAETAELQVLAAFVAIVVAIVTASVVAFRKEAPLRAMAEAEEVREARFSLSPVARTTATLLLPLFAITLVCWAGSRPCDPDATELQGAPTVARAATRPLPLARTGGESASDEGVWVVSGSKHLKEVWPRGSGEREIRLVVQRDVSERGSTGVFARFGDGRFGVLRMTVRERDAAPPTCPVLPGRRCIEASPGVIDARVTSVKSSGDPPSVAYIATPDETVESLARDVARLTEATYAASKTTAADLDVDLVVGLAGETMPTTKVRPSPAPRALPGAPSSAPRYVAQTDVVTPSAGCASPHAAATFEPHDLASSGTTRHLFVTALPAPPDPRPVIVVLHGNGGTATEVRRDLPIEDVLGARAVFIYPEARARLWDVDSPLGSSADAAFVRDAVAWAEATFCVDTRRHFVSGFSSGGYLANALACEGEFRAVATHGAGGPAPSPDETDPASGLFRCKKAAALVFHGEEDPKVPVTEGMNSAERWRVTNRCSPSWERDVDRGGSPCEVYSSCDEKVIRCIVPGLGHGLAADAATRTAAFFDAVR